MKMTLLMTLEKNISKTKWKKNSMLLILLKRLKTNERETFKISMKKSKTI